MTALAVASALAVVGCGSVAAVLILAARDFADVDSGTNGGA